MMTDLSMLSVDAERRAKRAHSTLAAKGVEHMVTSTFRTYLEQYALYQQGRKPLEEVNAARAKAGMPPITASENTYKVTNCDGRKVSEGGTGRSPHQLGTALDDVPAENGKPVWPPVTDPRWREIADAYVREGFTWGGDWDGDGKTRYDGDLDETMVDYPHYQLM